MTTEVNETKTTTNVKEKIQSLRKVITIEPLIAFYHMAQCLSKPALLNLEFEKACRVNLKFNDTVCSSVLSGHHEKFNEENSKIQVLVSELHSWQQPLQSFMPLMLALFLGSFSDRHHWRKPFLLLPMVGAFLGFIGCLLCVVFMSSWPLEAQGLSQNVLPSFFGGQTIFTMATTAYIADITTTDSRTLRLGIVQVVVSLIAPSVQSFSGILFYYIGYKGIFGISALMNVFGLCYGLFWVKEPRKRQRNNKNCFLDVFDFNHVTETFNLVLKRSPDTNRSYILLLIANIFIYRGTFDGESDLLYRYTQNIFHWTPLEYSYFLTVNSVTHFIGILLGVPLFTKLLRLNDLIIMLMTIFDKVLTNIIFGLAATVFMLYIGVLVSVVSRVYKVAKKSVATKIVSKNDIAKAQSLFGICEALAPSITVPLYNKLVYVNTLHTYPAVFFFFSVILYCISAIPLGWLWYKVNAKQSDSFDVTVLGVKNTTHN